jgi:hypothetical protein
MKIKIIHKAVRRNKLHKGKLEMTTLDNFMLDGLQSTTFINGKKDLIANDFSTGVFTLNEIQLFLYLNNFEILKTIDRVCLRHLCHCCKKAIHNYLIANRYFFKVNIATFTAII